MINVQNLKFYDKLGDPYNFTFNSDGGFWQGKNWLDPISIALFDSSNIFMLEGDSSDPRDNPTFPRLNLGETITFQWQDQQNSDVFFIYGITTDQSTGMQFIQPLTSQVFSYSDYSILNEDYPRAIQKMKVTVIGSTYILTWLAIPSLIYAYELYPGLIPVTQLTSGNSTSGQNSLDFSSFMVGQVSGQFTIALETVYPNSGVSLSTVTFNFGVDGSYVSQVNGVYTNPLSFAVPLQINIAFNPTQEKGYYRTLNGYYFNGTDSQKILQLDFYGEGEDEDERFRIWLQNFGIKFNREDALLLKDYDLTEGLPDYKVMNQKRKELLVNKDQIFPYAGTYKALINFIDIMGYKDILRVKEYWKNNNPGSEYYNKLAMVDITDVLDTGTVDTLDLIDLNRQIKFTNQFKKTNLLALVYEFDVLSGEYDVNGIPIVTRTTDFTVDEIFFKLNGLGQKLKNEFLPINVQIHDIIGEFLYFDSLTFRFWYDRVDILETEINRTYNIDLTTPDPSVIDLEILDIKSLYAQGQNGYPVISFNMSSINPFDNGQFYPTDGLTDFIMAINSFYKNRNLLLFTNPGQKPEWEFSDENSADIGCPIVLSLDITDLELDELTGVSIQELGDEHLTVEGIKYANFYEIEWIITKSGPNIYSFSYRGNILKLNSLPHILPYIGDYTIECRIYDLFGGVSQRFKHITVNAFVPIILGMMKIEDKFDYRIQNLDNITVQDMDSAYLYNPRTVVLDNDHSEGLQGIDIDQNFLDWSTYSQRYGFGRSQYDIQVADPTGNFVDYFESDNEIKQWWGTAPNTPVQQITDLIDATIDDMFHTRLSDMAWNTDFQNGFYIDLSSISPGISLTIGLFPPYVFPDFADSNDLVNRLNLEYAAGISDFSWSIVGPKLHANGRLVSKQLHNEWILGSSHVTVESDFTNNRTIDASITPTITVNLIGHAFDEIGSYLVFSFDDVGSSVSISAVDLTDNGDGTATITIDLTMNPDGINNTVSITVTDTRGGSTIATALIEFNQIN